MSIRDDLVQKVLGNPGMYSVQQLQQAMQAGTLPAYIVVPIIQDKVQQQKQMQMAQAMQEPSPEEQPPIAEQIMQEAAQMGGGVDQLPTNLPEQYAGGGIVAFEDGGMVDHYAGGGVVALSKGGDPLAEAIMDDLIRQQQIEKIREARDRAKAAAEAARTAGPSAAGAQAAGAAQTASQAASGPSKFESIRRGLQPGMFNPDVRLPSMSGGTGILKSGAKAAGKLSAPLLLADLVSTGVDVANLDTDAAREYYGMQLKPGEDPSFWGDVGVRSRAALGMMNPFGGTQAGIAAIAAKRRQEEAAAAAKQAAPKDEGAGEGGAGGAGAGGAGAGGAGAGGAGAEGSSFGDLFSQIQRAVSAERAKTKTPTAIFEENRKGFEAEEAKIAEERKAERERLMGTVPGQAYEGLEKDLRKEAEDMGVDKERAKHMAIFKAGLAMMAGTSRNALENIGKGAMVGVDDWQKAAADIKKAQKENQRMMAHIEQARRAEKIGDRDKQVVEMDKALDRRAARNQLLFSGAVNAGVKTEEQAMDLLGKSIVGATSMYGSDARMAATLARIAGSGAGRDNLTAYQAQRLLSDARREYPIEKARQELATAQKLTTVPKPGADKKFDDDVKALYARKIYELAGIPIPNQAGAGGGQQRTMPPEFKYLGRE